MPIRFINPAYPVLATFRERQVPTTRIILHDSHTTPDQSAIEQYLRTNGRVMGLLDVGYHYIVDRDGKIICTRPHMVQGSHTPFHNRDSIGICLAGGRDDEGKPQDNFTPEQMDALVRLLVWLETKYGWNLKIIGHTELQRFANNPTWSCPATDMDTIRERVEELKDFFKED